MNRSIDLILLHDGNAHSVKWDLGQVFIVNAKIKDFALRINEAVDKSNAGWVCIWDSKLRLPSGDLLKSLADASVDAWHAGLKLGLQGLPETLDYIDPAWLYNADADDAIVSSSFRLSLRACLINRKIFIKSGKLSENYESIEMTGLAYGYSLIKQGAIIRYHPDLVAHDDTVAIVSMKDEWVFTKEFFNKKWQYWLLWYKGNFWQQYKWYRQTKGITTRRLRPCLHPSNVNPIIDTQNLTVSVLAPTLDRYSYLENELKQLSEQSVLPLEVLITDQTDKDRRQEVNLSQYPQLSIRYFPQDEKGQCIAWNKLIDEAKGEYLLFLGDDADNIKPGFIEKLYTTLKSFDADMVASNVIELKAPPREINHHYYLSDTFPITLVKKALISDAGGMDMFFNRNIRADYDLAMRCHLSGALMIFDSSALVDHHRAPSGGLRTHNARKISNADAKKSITKFTEPTSSEIFLVKKYFNERQFRSWLRIKFANQIINEGSVLKSLVKLLVLGLKSIGMIKRYKANLAIADTELRNRGLYKY
ncbi:MAG: glycosyltransferase family 2 protein [Bacteroidetes bacterium]|nr:glycosyltransferase family 2 protein [Bacteroidota bacterium]